MIIDEHKNSENKPLEWCKKYLELFRTIFEDEQLRSEFQRYNVYSRFEGNQDVMKRLDECYEEAYDSGVVIKDYGPVIEESGLSDEDIAAPTIEWISSLSDRQILAAIAWHFRRDHFCEGSLISRSVADGHLLLLVEGYIDKVSNGK